MSAAKVTILDPQLLRQVDRLVKDRASHLRRVRPARQRAKRDPAREKAEEWYAAEVTDWPPFGA